MPMAPTVFQTPRNLMPISRENFVLNCSAVADQDRHCAFDNAMATLNASCMFFTKPQLRIRPTRLGAV